MTGIDRRPITFSLVTAGRVFVCATLAYAVVAAVFSLSLLQEIEGDARYTREHQIPTILARNVNAVKVERLASLVRSAFLARDSRLERQIQVETRALSQSFSLDGDAVLIDGGKRIADAVKTIVAYRTAERDLDKQQGDAGLRPVYDEAMHLARGLSDHLTTDAAFVADTMATKIEDNAHAVRIAWIFILAIPVFGSLAFFWIFRMHVARPIDATIDRLASIGTQAVDEPPPPAPIFRELRMIGAAVETYRNLADEMRRTNAILRTISNQDALTRVGNRRSFDAELEIEFEVARSAASCLALLLIDLDNFKRINDEHGHQVGDACLKSTGELLRTLCHGSRQFVARYGGEEFAILIPEAEICTAVDLAEAVRAEIGLLTIANPTGGSPIRFTASIGVASIAPDEEAERFDFVGAADEALYAAKRGGRNRVWPMKESAGRQPAPLLQLHRS